MLYVRASKHKKYAHLQFFNTLCTPRSQTWRKKQHQVFYEVSAISTAIIYETCSDYYVLFATDLVLDFLHFAPATLLRAQKLDRFAIVDQFAFYKCIYRK